MEIKFKKYIIMAICSFLIVYGVYFAYFTMGFSLTNSDWGTFGDYVGGVLNPILSFLGLIAILHTIKLQSKSLNISQKELEQTREELRQSKEISKSQVEHLKFQAKKEDLIKVIELAKSNIKPLISYIASINSETIRFHNEIKLFYHNLLLYDKFIGGKNEITDFYKHTLRVYIEILDRCGFDKSHLNTDHKEYIEMKEYSNVTFKKISLLN